MEIKDIREFLVTNKDTEEVQGLLGELVGKKDADLETFKSKIEEDAEFKSFVDSLKDKHTTKSLATWKENNLEELIGEEVKKRFPDTDPRDIALQELERKIEVMEQEKSYEKLRNVALKAATDRGLPTDLVDFFIGNDEETTLANLASLEDNFNARLEANIKSKFKDESYTPPKSRDTEGLVSKDAFLGMDFSKQQEFARENPEKYKEFVE